MNLTRAVAAALLGALWGASGCGTGAEEPSSAPLGQGRAALGTGVTFRVKDILAGSGASSPQELELAVTAALGK